jgi:heat shock protein HslJ
MRGIGVGRGRLSLKVLMGAAAILVSSTGCVARPEPSGRAADALIGRTIAYRCLDQTRFGVAMAPDGASVRLEGLASGPVTLPHVPSGSGARYSDERTTYRSKGAEATLELPGQPPRVCAIIADPSRLPGSRWRLARIQSMDGTEAAPDDRSRYTLEFGAAGALAGRADCNRISGRWTASGESITLGPLAMTRAMCPPGSLSDRYVRALEAAATWMIVDGRLAIAMRTDAGILHFEPAP